MRKIQFGIWCFFVFMVCLFYPGRILLAEINAEQKMIVDEFKEQVNKLSDEQLWLLRENFTQKTTQKKKAPCLCSPKTHIIPGTAAVIVNCSCGTIECIISFHPISGEPSITCFKN